MRTPKNILMHELIGLECEVVSSKNMSCSGIKGRIVDETMKTVIIMNKKKKIIEKKGSIFKVRLENKNVLIDGNCLVSRPEDRIKKKFKKW